MSKKRKNRHTASARRDRQENVSLLQTHELNNRKVIEKRCKENGENPAPPAVSSTYDAKRCPILYKGKKPSREEAYSVF